MHDSLEKITIRESVKRKFTRLVFISSLMLLPTFALLYLSPNLSALTIRDHLSSWNSKRELRQKTEYIILHTTEGSFESSLTKLTKRGEAHYLINKEGTVYKIIEPDKIAKHAGDSNLSKRNGSMWDGKENLDNYSIGIEHVGFYYGTLTDAQSNASRELIEQLQDRYNIPDINVLIHAMVSYGKPNKFHKNKHRGYKWCGTLFANPDVRKKLGLDPIPNEDPDVKAGRLVVPDDPRAKELFDILYGTRYVQEAEKTGHEDVGRQKPEKPTLIQRIESLVKKIQRVDSLVKNLVRKGEKKKFEDEKQVYKPIKEIPTLYQEFREISKHGNTAWSIAGNDYNSKTTIYFLTDGRVRRGDELYRKNRFLLDHLPQGTKILLGYIYGGHVSSSQTAYRICGGEWNYPTTYYRLPNGNIKSGNQIAQKSIPKKTLVFFRE